MEPISPVLFTFRGLTLGALPYRISDGGVSGWLSRPKVTRDRQPAPWGHGAARSPAVADPRVVKLRCFANVTRETRDQVVQQLVDTMWLNSPFDAEPEPLVGTMAGRTGTVMAYLDEFDPPTDGWSGPMVRFTLGFTCPDPRILGDPVTGSALLVVNPPGSRLSQRMGFRMAPKPIGGVVTIVNPGTDRSGSEVTVTLVGAQSGTVGVRSITTGALVTYDLSLGTADVLKIGSETGGELNGEYRQSKPYSSPAWRLRAQPGVNVYEALAQPGAGTPSISVSVVPAS